MEAWQDVTSWKSSCTTALNLITCQEHQLLASSPTYQEHSHIDAFILACTDLRDAQEMLHLLEGFVDK